MIYPPEGKLSKLGEEMLPVLADTVDKQHQRLLARKSMEKHKEEQDFHLLQMEREEELKRLKLPKVTEEAEQKRFASEFEQRKNQRILREIEEREPEEAQAMLQEAEKRSKKKENKPIIEGEKVMKQTLMELEFSEQLREKQEMEKKLQKLGKTMERLERAKREEETPLIEAAFQRRLAEEKVLYEHEQQRMMELCRHRHEGDLKEKNRLARMVDCKEAVMRGGQAEYENLKAIGEEVIINILITRKEEREIKRKMLYYLKVEQERLNALHLEEEVGKLGEAERRKREEAELRAKLDKIAEKQRQREHKLEERERLRIRKEAILGKAIVNPPTKTSNIPGGSRPSDPAPGDSTAAAPSAGKYVPQFRRHECSGQSPPAEPDRQGSAKPDDCVPPPSSDRQGSDDRRPSSFGGAGGGSRW